MAEKCALCPYAAACVNYIDESEREGLAELEAHQLMIAALDAEAIELRSMQKGDIPDFFSIGGGLRSSGLQSVEARIRVANEAYRTRALELGHTITKAQRLYETIGRLQTAGGACPGTAFTDGQPVCQGKPEADTNYQKGRHGTPPDVG